MTKLATQNKPQSTNVFSNLSPLIDLRREVESLFDNLFQRSAPPTNNNLEPTYNLILSPKTDISETEKGFELHLEMPGVKENEINVSVSNGVLTIEAEKTASREEEGKNFFRSERLYGSYRRSFYLDETTKEDEIQATYKNGVLHVLVPKSKESSKVKKIQVQALK